MKKVVIAAIAALSITALAPVATAGAGQGPCAKVAELFETANIQAGDELAPAGPVVGTVCKVTG